MTRWLRVQADIFDHPAFAASELSEREAWLWLIARAAWKDTRHRVGNEMVDVPRGSLFVTLRELRDTWGWRSDFRVRAFLDLLQSEKMIERNSNAGKTHITICNYCKYQDVQRTENASTTQAQRTENALNIPVYQDTKDITPIIPLSGDARLNEVRPKKERRKKLAGPLTYSPKFEIFWECYPPVANQSKAKAFEAYSRLDKPDQETAIDGALALTQWLDEEVKRRPNAREFVPHAATWINQRRWETLLETDHRSRYEQRAESP